MQRVDLFKVIEVQKDQGKRRTIPVAAPDLPFQGLIQVPGVEQTRELVGYDQTCDLLDQGRALQSERRLTDQAAQQLKVVARKGCSDLIQHLQHRDGLPFA